MKPGAREGEAQATVRFPERLSIIVDDEESARGRLGRMLAVYPDIVVVREARDGLKRWR